MKDNQLLSRMKKTKPERIAFQRLYTISPNFLGLEFSAYKKSQSEYCHRECLVDPFILNSAFRISELHKNAASKYLHLGEVSSSFLWNTSRMSYFLKCTILLFPKQTHLTWISLTISLQNVLRKL